MTNNGVRYRRGSRGGSVVQVYSIIISYVDSLVSSHHIREKNKNHLPIIPVHLSVQYLQHLYRSRQQFTGQDTCRLCAKHWSYSPHDDLITQFFPESSVLYCLTVAMRASCVQAEDHKLERKPYNSSCKTRYNVLPGMLLLLDYYFTVTKSNKNYK